MAKRTIQMNRWTVEKFQQLLHCGCSDLECECRKLPRDLVKVWARVKMMCDRMGHGGRNFSDESMALMVALSGCRDDLADNVLVDMDGAEMRDVPKRGPGRPPKKKAEEVTV